MAVARRSASGAHASRVVMARSRGMFVGVMLVIIGLWGALVPFVGQHFNYGFTPANGAWTVGRGWLEVLPGVAAVVGGVLIISAGNRFTAMLGGWLAVAAGAWFVLGTVVAPWWNAGSIGVPVGNANHAVWERLGMFDGLGVLVVLLAAVALGRSSVVGVRDVAAAENRAAANSQPALGRDDDPVVADDPVRDTSPAPAASSPAPAASSSEVSAV